MPCDRAFRANSGCAWRCRVRRWFTAGPCGNGYRSAKRQGKPNFTTTRKRLCRRHSCNFASAR